MTQQETRHIIELTRAVGELRGEITQGFRSTQAELGDLSQRVDQLTGKGCAIGAANLRRLDAIEAALRKLMIGAAAAAGAIFGIERLLEVVK